MGLTTAAVPLVMPGWQVFSYNSICVGLPLNTEDYPGSQYATAVFIGLNSAIFVLIAAGQTAIYIARWRSSAQVAAAMTGEQARRRFTADMAIARQLSLIVMTDFCCWFPVCVMGMLAQTGHSIPTDVYAWSAVVVLPVNSALNPLLYTAPTLGSLVARLRSRASCCFKAKEGNKSGNVDAASTQNISRSQVNNTVLRCRLNFTEVMK